MLAPVRAPRRGPGLALHPRRALGPAITAAALLATAVLIAAADAYKLPHGERGQALQRSQLARPRSSSSGPLTSARPNPNLAAGIALCEKELFPLPQGHRGAEQALGLHGAHDGCARSQGRRGRYRGRRALLGASWIRSTPPDVILVVDGDELPPERSAGRVELAPGAHKIEARAEGFALRRADRDGGQRADAGVSPSSSAPTKPWSPCAPIRA